VKITELPEPSKCVLVTGAGGAIGSALVQRLVAHGLRVRAMVRQQQQGETLRLQGVEVFYGDLDDPTTLRNLCTECSVVYHCAARLVSSRRQGFHATNIEGTRQMIKQAQLAQVARFVYLSSVAVYGYPDTLSVAEDHPWQATNDPYCQSKQAAERLLWEASKALPMTVVRPGDVFGPQQGTWTTRLVHLICAGLLYPPMSSSVLNPVYIDNLVDALLIVGHHSNAVGEAFNIVDGFSIPTREYIASLAVLAKRPSYPIPPFVLRGTATLLECQARLRGSRPVVTRDAAEFLLHHTTFCNAKARDRLSWSPRVGFEEGMRITSKWLLQQGLIPG